MAITVAQIPAAIAAVEKMNGQLNSLSMLLRQAKELADKGWQLDIGSVGGLMITISPQQQAAMIAMYDGLKTQLATTFQTLP